MKKLIFTLILSFAIIGCEAPQSASADPDGRSLIDPNMIGVIGFSAGGHLASSLSNHKIIESRPNFSVLLYPVITMNK